MGMVERKVRTHKIERPSLVPYRGTEVILEESVIARVPKAPRTLTNRERREMRELYKDGGERIGIKPPVSL